MTKKMDKTLKGMVEVAAVRGTRYRRGRNNNVRELPLKTAEFGAMLLMYSKRLQHARGESFKKELLHLQPFVDEFRRVIYEKRKASEAAR